MKSGLCVLVLVLVGGIAALVWHSGREKERAQQQVNEAQSRVQAAQEELEQARLREKQLASLPPQVIAKTNQPHAFEAQPPLASAKAAPSPAMLNDPETRALMKKQQDQQIAKLVDRFISSNFVRELNLTPEQTAQVKELVRAKANAGKEVMTAMLFDGLDDAALAQRGRETKQKIDAANASLRELLGTDGFNALTEREHFIDEREFVKRVRGQLGEGDRWTDDQEKSLLAAMSAERQAFPLRVDLSDSSKIDYEHLREYVSEANLQMHFEDMQQLNTRIAERAALFLSPAQLEMFKAMQQSRLDEARLTTKMTTELFNKRRSN